MSDDLPFERHFEPPIGVPEAVAPGVRRIVAPNSSPFTFRGTNTYIVGTGSVAIIDPGPDDAAHRAAIEQAIEGETVAAVVVTHTHRDHSPLAPIMATAHRAGTYAFGPHRSARPPHPGEDQRLDASNDTDFTPDVLLPDGGRVVTDDWSLVAVHTPGHTANHICLELEGTGTLFSGDHVMAWSTSVVAPPDGNMAAFMTSLDTLANRQDRLYLPGHGGALREPQRFVRLLSLHRRQRETAILKRLRDGVDTIPEIVEQLYKGLDPQLITAAGLSVLAHIEDLIDRDLVACDGDPTLSASFRAR